MSTLCVDIARIISFQLFAQISRVTAFVEFMQKNGRKILLHEKKQEKMHQKLLDLNLRPSTFQVSTLTTLLSILFCHSELEENLSI